MADVTSTAGMDTFVGQIIDLERDSTDTPSLEILNTVSDYKSGRHTALAPMQLGLLAAREDPAQYQQTLHRYSLAIGISGQMRDDYISFFGDPAVTAKPASVDVRAGRISYPIRQTLMSATGRERDFLRTILGRANSTDADVQMVQQIARTHRVDENLRTQMQNYGEQASAEAATWQELGWDEQAIEFFVRLPARGVEQSL
ncbi:polyprenyl synthetase family protein [Kitasatospora sp. NPDC056138]|uniref:polyprenyl synthetase family protein n=1 Tax=Kitasatospora sp. NPDC056138 TaxID=3345724 RepID=UPI0035DBE70C